MVSRAGRKERWHMANGNEEWVDPATLRNINKIYEFLEVRTIKAIKQKKRKPRLSYNQLSKATGITPECVQRACAKLAYKFLPFVKIYANSYRTPQGGRITQQVELIRFAEENEKAN